MNDVEWIGNDCLLSSHYKKQRVSNEAYKS